MSKGKGAAVNGKGNAKSNDVFYLAVPHDECYSILAEGFTCRRRSYVPVSTTPSEALFGFSRSARRAGARCARAAVVIEVRGFPMSKCVKGDEGFRFLTNHLPANLLHKASTEKGELERKLEEMSSSNQKDLETAANNASQLKAKQAEVAELRKQLSAMAAKTQWLETTVDKFSNVARPQYWKSKTCNAVPSFELIDVTSPHLTSWLESWMLQSSHEECKIGKTSPRINRVRRVESDAHWLRFQTQIVSMRTYHKQHGIQLKPIDPCVWYPSTNSAPQTLLDTLQSSMNEHLLFHGTSPETAENILKQGFDIVRTRDGSLYGAGFYFAQEFCKSAQYGRQLGGSTKCTVLICRVALGDVKYHTSGSFADMQRPKRLDGTVYDALIVEPRPEPQLQVHREFVVHESSQIYVEYAVDYEL